MDLACIDGKHLSSQGKNSELEVPSSDGGTYKLAIDKCPIHTTLRPVTRSSAETAQIGQSFSGSISVRRVFQLPTENSSAAVMAVPETYKTVNQLQGLTVRSLPFGSVTNIDDLKERLKIVHSSQIGANRKRAQVENDEQVDDSAIANKKDKKKKNKTK